MQKVAAEMLQEHTSANKQIFAGLQAHVRVKSSPNQLIPDLSPCGPKVIAVVATPSTCISEAEQSPLFSKPPYLCINDYLPAEGSRATGSGDEEGKEEGKKQENAAGSTEGPLQLNPEKYSSFCFSSNPSYASSLLPSLLPPSSPSLPHPILAVSKEPFGRTGLLSSRTAKAREQLLWRFSGSRAPARTIEFSTSMRL
eukprot:767777-Hanusia_phi.AAC.5